MERTFIPLHIAVLTVSDTRTEQDDKSGMLLERLVTDAGHVCETKRIVADDIYQIRAAASHWIADEALDVVLTTGGTGVTGRDGTTDALEVLFDKTIAGFGEMFRALSFQDIGTSSLQSRSTAGVANGTYIFCLPGSPGACKDAWEKIISLQLDHRTQPCNLVELMPRLKEK